jgi:tyrosinase
VFQLRHKKAIHCKTLKKIFTPWGPRERKDQGETGFIYLSKFSGALKSTYAQCSKALTNVLQKIQSGLKVMGIQILPLDEVIHERKKKCGIRERKSIRDLNPDELDNLIKAWRHIQELDPEKENSFFNIGGLHGEPFRGAGYSNSQWWGGWCHHGNVLFPTWHRAYLLFLENALRSVSGCEDVTLPYWDESDDQTAVSTGIPDIFLQKNYKGKPNPLYSYKLKKKIVDRLSEIPDADYSKPAGYETCRYPYSGLLGENDKAATQQHNNFLDKNFTPEKINALLNQNVQTWLNLGAFANDRGEINKGNTRQKFWDCLRVQDYTVFSNTTSAHKFNDDRFKPDNKAPGQPGPQLTGPAVALESPHNDIHVAIGGVEVPGQDIDQYPYANGDMGENDTASFDPIFYFHHCFIDYLFWKWQKDHNMTEPDSISIWSGYPGTNSTDAQGPTPGIQGNAWLTLDTHLQPFKYDNKTDFSRDLTSKVWLSGDLEISLVYKDILTDVH